MGLDQVLGLGYFTAYRLWFILDELKANDLSHFGLVNFLPHAVNDYREEINDWLASRQPRRIQKQDIPAEVLEKFAEAFNNG